MSDSIKQLLEDMKYCTSIRHEVWDLQDEILDYANRLEALIGEPVATTCFPDPEDERTGVRFSLADWKRLNALPANVKLYRLE